jgi:hypothetical protein
MADILTWLGTYSWPVVLLICIGGALLFCFKLVTEKAISREMDRYAKQMELTQQRRSNFEERILTERYAVLRDLSGRLMKISTDINRLHHGHQVENLLVNGDLAPLTEVFELIALNRYLIPQQFHLILEKQAQILHEFGNASDPLTRQSTAIAIQSLREQFDAAMEEHFGLNAISAKLG